MMSNWDVRMIDTNSPHGSEEYAQPPSPLLWQIPAFPQQRWKIAETNMDIYVITREMCTVFSTEIHISCGARGNIRSRNGYWIGLFSNQQSTACPFGRVLRIHSAPYHTVITSSSYEGDVSLIITVFTWTFHPPWHFSVHTPNPVFNCRQEDNKLR